MRERPGEIDQARVRVELEASDRQRAIEAGFDDHIVKPVAYVDLDRILSELMVKNKSPRTTR